MFLVHTINGLEYVTLDGWCCKAVWRRGYNFLLDVGEESDGEEREELHFTGHGPANDFDFVKYKSDKFAGIIITYQVQETHNSLTGNKF